MLNEEIKVILAIALSFLATPVTFAASTAENLVATMTDRTVVWDARCAAEDSLVNLPPQNVLPIPLPHIGKGMPSSAIWNGGGRDFDQRAPVEEPPTISAGPQLAR